MTTESNTPSNTPSKKATPAAVNFVNKKATPASQVANTAHVRKVGFYDYTPTGINYRLPINAGKAVNTLNGSKVGSETIQYQYPVIVGGSYVGMILANEPLTPEDVKVYWKALH